MARKARSWEPGAIHHVIGRGHCGDPLFATEGDRAFVVRRAVRAFDETGAVCLAWSILRNHYHVLVRCDGPPGPTFARLNTAIAVRWRRNRKERGAVFEDRYHSDPCEDETSLLQRLAYVLGNPLHHRVVASVEALRRHQWSALGEILGDREPRWTDVEAALALVHEDPRLARESILELVENKARVWAQNDGDSDGEPPIDDIALGDGARSPIRLPTTAQCKRSVPATSETTAVARISDLREELRCGAWDPGRIALAAARVLGAEVDAVRGGSQTRPAATARSIAAFVACDVAGWPLNAVAAVLGVGVDSLPYARRKGRERLTALRLSVRDLLTAGDGGVKTVKLAMPSSTKQPTCE